MNLNKKQNITNQLKAFSEKLPENISIDYQLNKITIKLQNKSSLFSGIKLFSSVLPLILLTTISSNPIFYIVGGFILFSSLLLLFRNDDSGYITEFDFEHDIISSRKLSIFHRLTNLTKHIGFTEVVTIITQKKEIECKTKDANTTSNNCYEVLLISKEDEIPIVAINSKVMNYNETNDFASIIKKLILTV